MICRLKAGDLPIRNLGHYKVHSAALSRSGDLAGAASDPYPYALRCVTMKVPEKDLRSPPGNRLEILKGSAQGYHAIRINDQWRVVFLWRDGTASDVQVVDYH